MLNNELKKIILPSIGAKQVIKEIGDFIIYNTLKLNCNGGVVGLSGGVDSTLTAFLAKTAFDNHNKKSLKKLELVAYILPSKINNPSDTADGKKIAEKLSLRYEIVDLSPVINKYKLTNSETFNSQYQTGNLISRIRATVINTKAMYENKLVLGTGNFDEDFGIGYYTLFGDGAVHLSPIGKLPKRLVKQLARANGFAKIADKEPTAGLEPKQTDFGDLGYSYETVEMVIFGRLQKISWQDLKRHPQIIKTAEQDCQRYKKLFGKNKYFSAAEIVENIKKRNIMAKSKGSLISPPLPKITLNFNK